MIAVPALEPLLPRRGAPPATAVIVGAGGFGKTSALDAIAAAYEKARVEVFRVVGRRLEQSEPFAALDGLVKVAADASPGDVRAGALERLGDGPWLLVVDDAHLLHEATLSVLGGIADRAGRAGGVIAAHRPAGSAALVALDDALTRAQAAVVLRPWTTELVNALALTLGYDAPPGSAEAILRATGGVPALITSFIEGATEERVLDQVTADGQLPAPRRVCDAVARELRVVGDAGAAVALGLACAVPPSVLAAVTGRSEAEASDALTALRHAGLLADEGAALVPIAARAVTASASAVDVGALRARAATALEESGAPARDIAPHLAAGGARNDTDRAALVAAADEIVGADATTALRWLEAAGLPDAAAGLIAEARLRTGDVAGAAALADRALAEASGAFVGRAAAVAATVADSRGQLRLAADRWAILANVSDAPTRQTTALARVAVLAAAVGDVERATTALRAAEATKPDTAPLVIEAEVEEARAALTAAQGDVEVGLEHFVRAAALFGPRPEAASVEASAALLAIAAGRDERARQLSSGTTTRQTAIRAWLKLRAGELGAAEADIGALVAQREVVPRDALLVASVAVGIARRGTDMVRLAAALDMAASVAAAADPDLMSLPVAGELAAGAVRVSPGEAERMIDGWRAVVAAAGSPPVWCAHLHWWRVQWAGAAADAAAAEAAARDLTAVAEVVPRFAPHAQAAQAWASVLAGDFAAATIAPATEALAAIGLSWEASLIAGAAALRTTEAGAARTLLGMGRDLRARLAVADTAAGGGAESDEALSAREREVAVLVVEGLTHREIGAQLYISAKTVEHHVANIRQKLGASTRAEMLAALRALLG